MQHTVLREMDTPSSRLPEKSTQDDGGTDYQARSRPFSNEILMSLPSEDRACLESCFSPVTFGPAATIQEADDPVEHIFFPTSGVASLQIFLRTGAVDTSLVGRESMLNPMPVTDDPWISPTRCIARTAMTAHKMPSRKFRELARVHPAIFNASVHYAGSLLHQTQVNASRYAVHSVKVRLATCLLEASRLLDSNDVPLAQETLGDMLAVRRTSVTEAANILKNAGAIGYARGKIVILDRTRLFDVARS